VVVNKEADRPLTHALLKPLVQRLLWNSIIRYIR